MVLQILKDKPATIFIGFTGFFVANALIAECIGIKIFSLERLFGAEPFSFSLMGESGLALSLTCGVLLWPLQFVVTDILNEYYGPKAVKRLSYLTVALISYAFLMFYMAMSVPPADFWYGTGESREVPDMSKAFNAVYGQGMWIIVGSLVAFLVSQVIDVFVFHRIRKVTGEKKIWLRATGSTLVSQFIDSFIVLFIAFWIGNDWSFQRVLAIGLVNYAYKFVVALLLTPLIYFIHRRLDNYLGHDTASKMRHAAAGTGET